MQIKFFVQKGTWKNQRSEKVGFEEKGRRGNTEEGTSRHGHGDRPVLAVERSKVVRLEQTFLIREMRVYR